MLKFMTYLLEFVVQSYLLDLELLKILECKESKYDVLGSSLEMSYQILA